jgi:hypothetical protein
MNPGRNNIYLVSTAGGVPAGSVVDEITRPATSRKYATVDPSSNTVPTCRLAGSYVKVMSASRVLFP